MASTSSSTMNKPSSKPADSKVKYEEVPDKLESVRLDDIDKILANEATGVQREEEVRFCRWVEPKELGLTQAGRRTAF